MLLLVVMSHESVSSSCSCARVASMLMLVVLLLVMNGHICVLYCRSTALEFIYADASLP